MILVGCSNSESDKNVADNVNPYEEFSAVDLHKELNDLNSKNLDAYYKNINGFIFYSTIKNTPKVKQFYNKRQKMIHDIDMESAPKTLRLDYNLFSKDQYVLSNSEDEYQYFGKLRNDKPTGAGIIISSKINSKIIYQGEFKDGRYDGYGILYEDSVVIAEGDFVEGKFTGEGNVYSGQLKTDSNDAHAANIVLAGNDGLVVISGKFEDGKTNGAILVYKGSALIYDGNSKNGHFDGDGTLYNDDGSVKYSGKWNMGDCAE